jgi:hypothetical protein
MMVRSIVACCLLSFLNTTAALAATDPNASPPAAKSRAAAAADAFAKQKAAADAKAKQGTASATKAPPQLPRLTAAQIVDKNVAARGGAEAWKRVQSLAMTGKMDAGRLHKVDPTAFMGFRNQRSMTQAVEKQATTSKDDSMVELPFVMELQRPRKLRLELTFRGDTAVQVYDGEHGWKLRPYLNRHEVEPFTSDELKVAAQQQELDGPLINYAAKGTKVELAGTDWVEDQPAYKLKLTLKTGDVRQVWLDGKTFLDIKIDGTPRRLDGQPHAVAVYSRDYRPVSGLMIPHVLETAVEGVKDTEKIHIEKVTLNPPLDGSRFAKPQ